MYQYYYRFPTSRLLHLDIWKVKSKDKSRLTAAEMKFMRKTAKYEACPGSKVPIAYTFRAGGVRGVRLRGDVSRAEKVTLDTLYKF
jgi:hypothetical protein